MKKDLNKGVRRAAKISCLAGKKTNQGYNSSADWCNFLAGFTTNSIINNQF